MEVLCMDDKEKSLLTSGVAGFIIVSILGTLFHYVYEWTGRLWLLGLVFPVNESTWEHMKLAFFPMLLYGIFMCIYLKKNYPAVCFAVLTGTIVATLMIPIIFYTYRGVLGFGVTWLDMLTFYLAVLIGIIVEHCMLIGLEDDCKVGTMVMGVICVIMAIAFFVFTYNVPGLGIFVAP